MAPRIPLQLLAALVLLSSAALVSEVHGARHHRLAAADGGREHRRLGTVEQTRDAGAAGRWSSTVRTGGGGHGGHGHGHGHGRGHGSGRDHGTPETPAVFYPRTVTGGNSNHHHGRNAAPATTTGPGRQQVARAMLVAAAAVLLLRL